ncbi:MAG: pyridoxamine 5'-phosphate oxidase family protein [Thermomicrobiales bacterium]
MAEKEPVAARPLLAEDASPTPWAEARDRLEAAGSFWLATARPDGRPHVRPILAIWLDGALYFVANAASRKARNLARDPRCVITATSHDSDLVVDGEAAIVRDEATPRRVADRYAAKYDWHVAVRDGAFFADGAPTAGPPPYDVYEVTLTTVFAFGKDESFRPTRWRFSRARL